MIEVIFGRAFLGVEERPPDHMGRLDIEPLKVDALTDGGPVDRGEEVLSGHRALALRSWGAFWGL